MEIHCNSRNVLSRKLLPGLAGCSVNVGRVGRMEHLLQQSLAALWLRESFLGRSCYCDSEFFSIYFSSNFTEKTDTLLMESEDKEVHSSLGFQGWVLASIWQ